MSETKLIDDGGQITLDTPFDLAVPDAPTRCKRAIEKLQEDGGHLLTLREVRGLKEKDITRLSGCGRTTWWQLERALNDLPRSILYPQPPDPPRIEMASDATLRDLFAAAALTGINTNPLWDDSTSETMAIVAYKQADAMIAARSEKP